MKTNSNKHRRGQTIAEYLMLLGVSIIMIGSLKVVGLDPLYAFYTEQRNTMMLSFDTSDPFTSMLNSAIDFYNTMY